MWTFIAHIDIGEYKKIFKGNATQNCVFIKTGPKGYKSIKNNIDLQK